MPLADTPIVARRAADNAIASAYATRGLGAHSPSAERPGPIAHAMCTGFAALGYAIGSTATRPGTPRVMLEVFPHATAIALVGAAYRVPYKLGRIRQYWPDRSPEARRRAVLAQWAAIRRALDARLMPRPACSVTVTAIGEIGERIEGSFVVTLLDSKTQAITEITAGAFSVERVQYN
jgi:hypothetical protein